MEAFAGFDEIPIAGYLLNGLLILDLEFANLAPPIWMTGDPNFLLWI